MSISFNLLLKYPFLLIIQYQKEFEPKASMILTFFKTVGTPWRVVIFYEVAFSKKFTTTFMQLSIFLVHASPEYEFCIWMVGRHILTCDFAHSLCRNDHVERCIRARSFAIEM